MRPSTARLVSRLASLPVQIRAASGETLGGGRVLQNVGNIGINVASRTGADSATVGQEAVRWQNNGACLSTGGIFHTTRSVSIAGLTVPDSKASFSTSANTPTQVPGQGGVSEVSGSTTTHEEGGAKSVDAPVDSQVEKSGDGAVPEDEQGGTSVNPKMKEVGGPRGPEPTRYGDWEKGGRCSDF